MLKVTKDIQGLLRSLMPVFWDSDLFHNLMFLFLVFL